MEEDRRLKQCFIDGICEGITAALVVFTIMVVLLFVMFTTEPSGTPTGMIMANIWR